MKTRNVNPAIFLSLLIFPLFSIAQDYASTKEKIYIHTNHVFYRPGDIVYFKLYVVNAQDQAPAKVSDIVYVELISPSGTIVQKSNYGIRDGYSDGSFDFKTEAPGGIYKIRAYTSWMQNEKDDLFFVKEITLQNTLAPRVLMKLEFPEKGYGAGDIAKANFSMRNLADQPIRGYEGKYTVSIGGIAISTGNFQTDNNGKAVIPCRLPNDLAVNDGLLNVTIEYDSYVESISRSIPIVLNKIDLQFMPEGGTLIEGVPGIVAFKALNEYGKAADIKGEIRDQAGKKVASFESYHFGMGKFTLTPLAGHTYRAYITSPSTISQTFDLPVASVEGVALHIEKQDRKIAFTLSATSEMPVTMQASSRGKVYFTDELSLKPGSMTNVIDEKIFPPGITQFTLYSASGVPLCERLVFMNEHAQLNIAITPDKQKYLPREKVNLVIKTTDEHGKALPSNISLAVVDDKLWTFADDKQDNILSWLLLSSELKGKIEEPFFYFKKDEPKATPALDLLMMTQGYRYFDYIDMVVKEGMLRFLPDQPNILSGKIVDIGNRPVKSTVYLLNDQYAGKGMKITTNDNGEFFFTHLQPQNRYVLFAHALSKKKNVYIMIQQNGMGFDTTQSGDARMLISRSVPKNMAPVIAPPVVKVATADKKIDANLVLGGQQQSNLSEVVVVGYGFAQNKKELSGSVSIVSNKMLEITPNLNNALAGKVAGVQITQTANYFDNSRIVIRGQRSFAGNNQPLYVVNGIVMDQFSLNTINPNDIEAVTVMKDAAATSIYGSRGVNGVIQIDLKKWRREKIRVDLQNHSYYTSKSFLTGGNLYSVARKFYVPKYQTTATEERTDFRETIYWNPVVQTGEDGTAKLEFYNSDASTTFRAIAEGLGYNGKAGRGETTYAAQPALQVDAKIPPYLTIGDKALIPFVVKNNGISSETFTVTVNAPVEFRIGNFDKEAMLLAGGSVRILVPVEALLETKGELKFIVSSASSKEVVRLPIVSSGKGFPSHLSFSGDSPSQYHFNIGNMVPGSLNAQVKVFRNMESQLLDGIESMLREPYGCFEQTSSTTYPNIFVLKYLKETGRSNREIEKKAMNYINAGYQRLIGFETQEGGFEWFGKTPPHEALTAYGLLEFTDMQQFIEVDRKMLERTKKFLLSRRDGNGAFKLATGGYDRFASVPNKIANVYIVYALAKAGMGKEVLPEYRAALKDIFKSKDCYLLAMMANTAHFLNDEGAYQQLLAILDRQTGLEATTSVVNSRASSLRIETVALYANALMKSKTPDLGKIARLLSELLSGKSYYGYGSTQATVLALEAMVNYSKLTKKISDDSPILFTVNTKAIASDSSIRNVLQEGDNSVTVTYPDQANGLPYAIDISYNTFLPSNSIKSEIHLATRLQTISTKMGETVRMEIDVTNTKDYLQPMAIAKIGIPAGLIVQPWQLKEIMEKNKAAYYEIFDNYLVFYWMGFAPMEVKKIQLDLKAEIPGIYKGKASTAYLYYTPEYKYWSEGVEVSIGEGIDEIKVKR